MTHTYQKIGIIAAMQVEAEALKREILNAEETVVSGLTFTEGTLFGMPVVLAVCGEGKVNAAICAQTMILRYSPSLIIKGHLCRFAPFVGLIYFSRAFPAHAVASALSLRDILCAMMQKLCLAILCQ